MSTGADKIVSSIISDAQSKAESIKQEAELNYSSIVDEGKNTADKEKEKILEAANKQSQMRYQQIISEAKMNARRMELEAREEIIEEAFSKAEEKLAEIASSDSSQYIESLKKIITEAAIEIGGGDLLVMLKEDDIPKIRDSISELEDSVSKQTGITTKLETGDTIPNIGGAILKTRNGEIEVNNTIEARMLRFKKNLRSEVAHVLFQ